MTDFDADAIPDELRERDQWVCWAEEERNGKLTKIPKRPDSSGRNAKSSDMATWGGFEDAVETAEREEWGIGFMFSDAGPYVGLDLDHCLTDAGRPRDWLPSIEEFINETFIEHSPSGGGLHILFRDVQIPSWWTNQEDDTGGVELYDSGRFFTVTGETINGSAESITDAGDLGGWLLEAWGVFNDEMPRELREDMREGSADVGTGDLDVYDVLSRASYPEGERVAHPYHSSSTGSNFKVGGNGESWRCFSGSHDTGGYAIHLIGMEHGIVECGEWSNGGLDDATWREIFDAARGDGYDIPEPDSKTPDTDGSEVVETGDGEERELPTPADLEVNDGGYGFHKERDDGTRDWIGFSNFQLETQSFATDPDDPDKKQIELTVHPAKGEAYDVTIPPTVFNEKREFKSNVVTGLTTTFSGKENILNQLKTFVGTQDAPLRTGTYQMGRMDGEWVTPEGVLTGDGWSDEPEHVHVSRDIGAERKWDLTPDEHDEYDSDEVAEILELLPETRDVERFVPALGWFYATPFKPLIHEWTGQFNLLGVLGETGAGKSATLSVLWELFGMGGDPMTADDTKYVLLTTLASTNSIPMWFDEYKPSDMSDWAVDTFWNEIRKTTRGGVSARGNPDGSTTEYHLNAPAVVSGEERVHGSAEERRGIYTTFKKTPTDPESESASAFADLVGGSAKNDGEREYHDGHDLSQHALAYYQWALSQDDAEVREQWRESARHVSELLEEHDIEAMEDLVEQGLQTIKFGAALYRAFTAAMGGDAEAITTDEIDGAILYVATNAIGGANRKSHLDVLFEVAARAARHDYLEAGTHYKFVREGEADEEFRLNLTAGFDKIVQYGRDHDVAEDLLNSKDDYRERIGDALDADGGYIAKRSIPTSPIGRAVGIYVRQATESIDGFDKSMFGGGDEDESAIEERIESAQTAVSPTAVADLSPGYQTLTVECVTKTSDTPDVFTEMGTLRDATGTVDYVVWERAEPVDLEEGETYRIRGAQGGTDPDDAPQVELDGRTAEIEPVDAGVGYLSLADSGGNERLGTATDGGEYEQAKPRMKELLREHGVCSEAEWKAKAHQAGISDEAANGAFESLKAQGEVYRRPDGGWEVSE